MNLIELQDVLGKSIKKITDNNFNFEEKEEVLKEAEYVAKIAKQMINNADIILRSEKAMSEGQNLRNMREIINGN